MKPLLPLSLGLVALLLAACNLSYRPDPGTAGPVIEIPVSPSVTATPSSSGGCYFNWATQALPELSQQVQTAVDAAGLAGVSAYAEAFGENCYDYQTNQVVYFATMETDFRLAAQVEDLGDRSHLGDLVERILIVLDNFPVKVVPGPQAGYIAVRFQAGEHELNLWFLSDDGKSARARGLHGAELLDELQGK